MAQIHVLDSETIDKIAAGEVVERPASVVKELIENALDAGASAITIECKGGGIEFLRVTDNGCGMEQSQVRNAFLRHATSKIQTADDLTKIISLGFRGEALSSISAVSKVEMITKPADRLTGTKIVIEGGREISFEEVGAPDGTTFIMRNLFYNTPVRRKFLKQPATEGGAIADLCQHLALSRPDVSFQLIQDNRSRFHTSGNGDLREVIYRIFGRDTAKELIPIRCKDRGITVEGYLGTPSLVRPNRSQEIYFINGRFIRSTLISRAAEEGYKEYLMQHKFPFLVLHLSMDTSHVDVNVHPTKMDVRFTDPGPFSVFLKAAVESTLRNREMIPTASLLTAKEKREEASGEKRTETKAPEVFEKVRSQAFMVQEETAYRAQKFEEILPLKKEPTEERKEEIQHTETIVSEEFVFEETSDIEQAEETDRSHQPASGASQDFRQETMPIPEAAGGEETVPEETILAPKQLDLFEGKILTRDNRKQFRLIGQVFDTYWLIEYEDQMLMIDQHAAHEKVNFERMMSRFREKTISSQRLMPPTIVTVSGQEEQILLENKDVFEALGFEFEPFGGNEYALRGVPTDLYGCGEREMFLQVLESLAEGTGFGSIRSIEEKIASMACKASVKGNQRLSQSEAEHLIDELLLLDNPYNCPHGRPTIVVITKSEMEKKFKRIV
ncbi:MAG: DNA mismatch repair endonuclease MutL [Acetatifactor sp.]